MVGEAKSPWTSTLSTSGLAVLGSTGFRAAGFVTASSVWTGGYQFGQRLRSKVGALPPGGFYKLYRCPHAGRRYGGGPLPKEAGSGAFGGWTGRMYTPDGHEPGINWEHVKFAEGIAGAFGSASIRLLDETRRLGAHGVVDVNLTLHRGRAVAGINELTLTGTAVVIPGGAALEEPFASFGTVADLTKYLAAGWAPVGICLGAAAIEAEPGCQIKIVQSGMRGRLEQYADALDQARWLASQRMEETADRRADAVLGCSIEERLESERHAYGAEVVVTGTAAKRLSGTTSRFQPPLKMLRLRS